MTESATPRPQLRQARLAEVVADRLRDRILSGDVHDGDLLPKQEELFADFKVSRTAIREALQILETERLITVRRGNLGGAVVHAPDPDGVAYTMSLVLQSRAIELADAGLALRLLEPLAAQLCAGRTDRADTVVPRLRLANEALDLAIEAGDEIGAIEASREFHEAVVDGCGNETMKIVLGAVETLWSAHEASWAEEAALRGDFPDPSLRRRGLDEHAEILRCIEAGDTEAVVNVSRHHLEGSQQYPLGDDAGLRVRAAALRRRTLG